MTGLEVLEVSFFNPLVLFYSGQVFNTFSGLRHLFGRLYLASLPLHGRRGCDPCCEGGIDIFHHMNQLQTLTTVYIDILIYLIMTIVIRILMVAISGARRWCSAAGVAQRVCTNSPLINSCEQFPLVKNEQFS